ncbi:MAG: RNA polymerase factor sigma-32 [Alphaproteobacteria bacterium]|nr:RNA polymerase factor sigma-32 [Alphaproteobacteria bacterium]
MAHFDDHSTQRANTIVIRRAMKAPLLARAREQALARRWRETGDQTALAELVGAYGRLVVSIALRFRHYGLPVGDLIQEGHIGLLQAAQRFEPARDVRFSTYAQWWIRAAIQDFVLRNWSIVRTGTTSAHKALFFNLRRLRARLEDPSAERMNDAQRAEIARQLRVDPSAVVEMEGRLAAADRSLDAPLGEESDSDWNARLVDERPTPESATMAAHDARVRARVVHAALGELDPRERAVIEARRLDENGVTLEALGVRLGISKERVRQIENRALGKLKTAICRRIGDPAELIAG